MRGIDCDLCVSLLVKMQLSSYACTLASLTGIPGETGESIGEKTWLNAVRTRLNCKPDPVSATDFAFGSVHDFTVLLVISLTIVSLNAQQSVGSWFP